MTTRNLQVTRDRERERERERFSKREFVALWARGPLDDRERSRVCIRCAYVDLKRVYIVVFICVHSVFYSSQAEMRFQQNERE